LLTCLGALALSKAQPESVPSFSGIHRPAGLAVQPCGHNEWMRRSFETDKSCLGSDEGFPFRSEGLSRWEVFSPRR
jgi:hypothetical protein